MDFDDLLTASVPPDKRASKCNGPLEHHFSEGAVMLAYAMHLINEEDATEVTIRPDGEHGKRFDFAGRLAKIGFEKIESTGKTAYGGTYKDVRGHTIVVHPKSGLGDVEANLGTGLIVAECKGGIINTRHSGQCSRLRKGLLEAVGQLLSMTADGRQVAVVPYTQTTDKLARTLATRCASAGIEIALVKESGEVVVSTP